MPSGFFWGGFSKGMQDLGHALDQRERLKVQREESKLRQKMLDLQTKKIEQGLIDDARQRDAVESMARTVEQGQPFDRPAGVEGPLMESGAFGQTQGNPQLAAMMRAQPKEAVTGMLRQQFGNSSGMSRGYSTLQEAQAAAKAAGISARIEQSPFGFFIKQVLPVNVAANRYHQVLNQTGNESLALQAFNEAMFGGSAASGAGSVSGKAAQELGEPAAPFVGIQGQAGPAPGQAAPAPMQPAPPPPLAQPARPQPDRTPRPTPAGGSQAQRALRQRESIQREEQALPTGLQDTLAKGGTLKQIVQNIRSTYKPEYTNRLAGTKELEMRRRFGGMVGLGVGPEELQFRQHLQSAANLIVYLQTGKQINEAEAGRLNATIPQAYDIDEGNFLSSLDRFENEMHTIIQEQSRTGRLSRGLLEAFGQSGGASLPPPPAGWR